jgi:hypothetical protein
MIASILWGFKAEKAIDPKTGKEHEYDTYDFIGEVGEFPPSKNIFVDCDAPDIRWTKTVPM